MWDDFQTTRLEFEKARLIEDHPNCEFYLGNYVAIARIWHNVGGSWYRLRVEVPSTYPDQKPSVYIEVPVPLPSYRYGRNISEEGPSHNYHTLTPSDKGEVQICHFSPDHWDATKSIHLVVLKAKLWLQAYAEHHLKTGEPICAFFNDCR